MIIRLTQEQIDMANDDMDEWEAGMSSFLQRSLVCPIAVCMRDTFGIIISVQRNKMVLHNGENGLLPIDKNASAIIEAFDERGYWADKDRHDIKPTAFYIPGWAVEEIERYKKEIEHASA